MVDKINGRYYFINQVKATQNNIDYMKEKYSSHYGPEVSLFNNRVRLNQSWILETLSDSETQSGTYLVAIGLQEVQGHHTGPVYLTGLHFSQEYYLFKCGKDINSGNEIRIQKIDLKENSWSGLDLGLKAEPSNDGLFYDFTTLILQYSGKILLEGYNEYGVEITEEEFNSNPVTTKITSWARHGNRLSFQCELKHATPENFSKRSIKYQFNLIPLPKCQDLMMPRLGDRRVGYFTNTIQTVLTNPMRLPEPIVIIRKRNLAKCPWVYFIDPKISEQKPHLISAIKEGVENWNRYFQELGINQKPIFKVKEWESTTDFNPFNCQANYILAHDSLGLNSIYTGLSQDLVDYRTGEIICGNICINFEKLEQTGWRYFNMYSTKTYSLEIQKKAIYNSVVWIVGHEIGHQLGLRHNFVGNLTDNGYGSVMDYIEFFHNYEKFAQQDYSRLRTYDLHAIRYGYTPLLEDKLVEIAVKNNNMGKFHSTCQAISSQSFIRLLKEVQGPALMAVANANIPFKTDEHLFQGVIPDVGYVEDEHDLLFYIENVIDRYRKFRTNLIHHIELDKISSYEFANAFLFIYINCYRTLIDLLGKYIGGRFIEFYFYRKVRSGNLIYAMQMFAKLRRHLKYHRNEYKWLTYEFDSNVREKTALVKVNISDENYYGFNTSDLFTVYTNQIDLMFDQILREDRLIRLTSNAYSNRSGQKQLEKGDEDPPVVSDFFYQFAFSVREKNSYFLISDYDGIFPEFGLLELQDHILISQKGTELENIQNKWRKVLNQTDSFDQYMQFRFLQRLKNCRPGDSSFFLLSAKEIIFQTILKHKKTIMKETVTAGRNLTAHYRNIYQLIETSESMIS